MIDMIQRLGIEYYFEEEIKAAIQKQLMTFTSNSYCRSPNYHFALSEVALLFRLLRQEGYFIHLGENLFIFVQETMHANNNL